MNSNNGDIKISIITVLKNGGDFIENCIQNLIEQNCNDLEHILIDGASTDSSLSIIKSYSNKYHHIRYVSEPDNGQSNAMNKGVQISKGNIIGFLNVDDFYEPNTLNDVIDIFTELAEPALVVGNCNVLNEDGLISRINKPSKLSYSSLLSGLDGFPCNPSAYFFHRSLQNKVGAYLENEHMAMDLDFLIKATRHANVHYFDKTFGNFLLHSKSKTYQALENQSCEPIVQSIVAKHLAEAPLKTRLYAYVKRYIKTLVRFF